MTKDDRNQIYRECFEALGIKQFELARLMALGEVSKSTRNKVSEKLKGTDRGVTKETALAIQLLVFIQQSGIDIKEFEFDENGRLNIDNILRKDSMADIQLHMTFDQAKAVSLGLEIFTRLGLGQLEYLEEHIESGVIPRANQEHIEDDGIQTLLEAIRNLLGYAPGASHGMNSHVVDVNVKRAFEIKRVLDRAMKVQTGESSGKVVNDPLPVRFTIDELPTATATNSKV